MFTTDSMQPRTDHAPVQPTGVIARTAGQVRQFICGLHGHDALLHFEHGRVSLLCTSCGHESPGWDTRLEPTRVAAVKRAPRLMRMPFLNGERAA
jgi:hypothetical protein